MALLKHRTPTVDYCNQSNLPPSNCCWDMVLLNNMQPVVSNFHGWPPTCGNQEICRQSSMKMDIHLRRVHDFIPAFFLFLLNIDIMQMWLCLILILIYALWLHHMSIMASEIIGNLTVCLRNYQSSTLLVFFQGSSFRKIFTCPTSRILQFLYMLIQYKEVNLLKSTCLTSSFTCPGPSGSGKCWALLFEGKHKIFMSLALFEGKHKKNQSSTWLDFCKGNLQVNSICPLTKVQ